MTRYLDELACTRASGSGFVCLGADRKGALGTDFITVRISVGHRGKQCVKRKFLCDMYTCMCICLVGWRCILSASQRNQNRLLSEDGLWCEKPEFRVLVKI